MESGDGRQPVFRTPACGMMLPTHRMDVPTSVKPLWRQPCRHMQRSVSQEIPNPVHLTTKVTITGKGKAQPKAPTDCPFRRRHSRLDSKEQTQGEKDAGSTVFLIHLLFSSHKNDEEGTTHTHLSASWQKTLFFFPQPSISMGSGNLDEFLEVGT